MDLLLRYKRYLIYLFIFIVTNLSYKQVNSELSPENKRNQADSKLKTYRDFNQISSSEVYWKKLIQKKNHKKI